MSDVITPCVGVCELDAKRAHCRGCGRSLAEIAAWRELDDRARRAIMARLGTAASLAGGEATIAPRGSAGEGGEP